MAEPLRQPTLADCFDPNRDKAAEAAATLHLKAWGYAPGDYFIRCIDCDQQHIADKRAWRCLGCAEKQFTRAQADEREDDYALMQDKLGAGASDAEVLAAVMAPDAKVVPFEKDNRRTLHDFDLPDFVRAFVAMNQGPATETMAIRSAGMMPKVYATYTPPEGEPFRVRIVMVSRLGDVGISREDKEHGYFTRLSIYDLTDFDTVMHPEAPAKRRAPKRMFAIADKKGRWVRINPGANVLTPVALSAVPVLYERSKSAYKDVSAVDRIGMRGLQIVTITFTVENDDA